MGIAKRGEIPMSRRLKRRQKKPKPNLRSKLYSEIININPWVEKDEFVEKTIDRYQELLAILRDEIIRLEFELKKYKNEGIRKISV